VGLTARTLEVLQMTANGFTAGQIATRLKISESTAKDHRHRAIVALGACNGTHAVAIALRGRIIT
jgi:LuxR family quorum sensing-dependent transcriptional regulator